LNIIIGTFWMKSQIQFIILSYGFALWNIGEKNRHFFHSVQKVHHYSFTLGVEKAFLRYFWCLNGADFYFISLGGGLLYRIWMKEFISNCNGTSTSKHNSLQLLSLILSLMFPNSILCYVLCSLTLPLKELTHPYFERHGGYGLTVSVSVCCLVVSRVLCNMFCFQE
jgi:hypothetical protein